MPSIGHFTLDSAYAFNRVGTTYAEFPSATYGGAMTFSFHVKIRSWNNWQRIIDFGKGLDDANILIG